MYTKSARAREHERERVTERERESERDKGREGEGGRERERERERERKCVCVCVREREREFVKRSHIQQVYTLISEPRYVLGVTPSTPSERQQFSGTDILLRAPASCRH